ncbi:hypothetical protein SLA2020_113320 [Shorea laevis]
MNALIQSQTLSCSSEFPDSLWIPTSSALQGPKSMADYENENGALPFFHLLDKEEDGDDDFDGSYSRPGKKRRLTASQVEFLEKSFEVENKLEPARKIRLAKELGLQPRQVAIWFQNRRARFKNKQLEKDYDSLKSSYDKLKNDSDNILKEKEDLKNQILSLKEKLLKKRGEGSSVQIDAIDSWNSEPCQPISDPVPGNVSNLVCKQEESISAKSVVLDSESPIYTDGNNSSLMDPADSSNVFEPEQSDFSQEEDDNLNRSLLDQPYFLKLEDDYSILPENSCSFGFPVEDQSFWSSLY